MVSHDYHFYEYSLLLVSMLLSVHVSCARISPRLASFLLWYHDTIDSDDIMLAPLPGSTILLGYDGRDSDDIMLAPLPCWYLVALGYDGRDSLPPPS